jgi:hypothetical protein
VPDAQLVRFARALLAAQQRLRTAGVASLATDLPMRAVGPMDEFEARLAATRGIYLPDGLVSPEQVQETITIVRSHTPLPASLRIPRPDELLHTEPLRQALKALPPR